MTALSASKSSAFEPGPLDAGVVHLWLGSASQFSDSDSFRRLILSRYAGLAPDAWRFATGDNGKPRLLDPPRPLDFNLSHSGDWLACAVTAGAAVGVDLERCDDGRDVLRLARRYFRSQEADALECLDPPTGTRRFYDYWTLKEAWVKAAGEGIWRGLGGVGFRFLESPAAPLLLVAEPDADDFPRDCWLLELADCRLALCVAQLGPAAPGLRVFSTRPGGASEACELPLKAASARVLEAV